MRPSDPARLPLLVIRGAESPLDVPAELRSRYEVRHAISVETALAELRRLRTHPAANRAVVLLDPFVPNRERLTLLIRALAPEALLMSPSDDLLVMQQIVVPSKGERIGPIAAIEAELARRALEPCAG